MILFNRYDLREIFEKRKKEITNYINNLSDEDALSEQDETIINNLIEQHKFFLVKIKDESIENRTLKKESIKKYNTFHRYSSSLYGEEFYYVDGVLINSTFPFEGDSVLFHCKASTFYYSGQPEAEMYENYFILSASETLDMMDKEENKNLLFDSINKKCDFIKKNIDNCNNDCLAFNNSLKEYIENLLAIRKSKADKFNNISKLLEIPIQSKNPKLIEEIKLERRIIPLLKREKENNYSISNKDYLDILEMIKHYGSTFERTPSVYNNQCEENLRDFILAHLNGMFKGKANGECFRKKGKTDISIEYENRAAFVAECKIWSGKAALLSALAQLTNYITWRDNKLSLIIFSKNKDFFKVLEEIELAFSSAEEKISFTKIDKNEFEYKFKSENNENQILTLRIFAFNLSI